MKVDRDQLIEDGYIILREVVPPDSLENLRVSAEKMVQRQKAIWARERGPADPPGGVWETAPQPRLVINGFAGTDGVELVDEETAPVVEFWLHENVLGVSTELLCDPDAGVTEMMMMCNPVRDHGPADWHRDVSATFHGPLQSFVDDALENGPRYVQWNIPLYDDGVLWVVPGSHRRINTPEENRRLDADPRVPLPGSVCTGLKAGDGVVYMQPILHWASNYSTRLRRTIHGGFCMWSGYRDLSFTEHLTPSAKSTFDGWLRRSGRMQDLTESALRAATAGDVTAYRTSPGGPSARHWTRRQEPVDRVSLKGRQEHPGAEASRPRRFAGGQAFSGGRRTDNNFELGSAVRRPILLARGPSHLAAVRADRYRPAGRRSPTSAGSAAGAHPILRQ